MVIPAIQKVADLRGKVLAVSNPGSLSDFAAKLFITRQGLKPGQDISVTYSGSTSAAFAALVNGRVHGIFASSPSDVQAQAAGFKQLLDLGDMNIPFIGNCTAAMRPYIAKQPGRMRNFVASITEAIAYVKRRPGETKNILQNISGSLMPLFCNIPMISNPSIWSPCRVQAPKGLKPSWNNLA
jgi:ABC-type nitrate/sulfonate/bicarbonate transport system substrate-binding protein